MDTWSATVFLQLPMMVAISATAANLVWWNHEGLLCRLAGGRVTSGAKALFVAAASCAWLVLTLASWWCLLDWALLTVVGFYVWFGVGGGWTALVGTGAAFASVPFVWGWIIVRVMRREFQYASAFAAQRPAMGTAKPPLRGLPS